EGAKRELDAQARSTTAPRPPPPAASADATTGSPEHGRIDALTIGAAGLAVAGIAVGSVFGVMALNEKPSSSFVTGRDGSYADLVSRADDAHAHARIADIGFAVGIVAT